MRVATERIGHDDDSTEMVLNRMRRELGGRANTLSRIQISLGVLFVVLATPMVIAVIAYTSRYSNSGEEVRVLRTGADKWNEWRERNDTVPYLERADLSGLDLCNANLAKATFYDNGGIGADLRCTLLRGANLTKARLPYVLASGADFRGANCDAADFSYSDLRGSNISGARARHSSYIRADLSNTDLTGCDFFGANFLLSNLTTASVKRADFSGAYLAFADFTGVEDWKEIKAIQCANIFGIRAPFGFREWALQQGAMEFDWNEFGEWKQARDDCMEAIGVRPATEQ